MSKPVTINKTLNFVHHYAGDDPLTQLDPAVAAKMTPTYPHFARLRLTMQVKAAIVENQQTVWISLKDSEISSGGLFSDTTTLRGYFQDRVDVSLSTDHDDLSLTSDGPQDADGTANIGSSVSVSDSTSGNVGFFGPETGTGGAAVSHSTSSGSSFSASIENFGISNTSSGNIALHSYEMRSTAEGHRYKTPKDLQKGTTNVSGAAAANSLAAMGPVGRLVSAVGLRPVIIDMGELYEVPDRSKDNMPLISQAVWKNQTGALITDRIKISIRVSQHIVKCTYGTLNRTQPSMNPPYSITHDLPYHHNVVVDLAKVAGQEHLTGTTL